METSQKHYVNKEPHMIDYRIATKDDINLLMDSRLEALKVVNNLEPDYQFSPDFTDRSRTYFENGNQTTVLALMGETVIGCASICYINIMPTFSHPTGKRAHLMNVYTNSQYRRKGVAYHMVNMLIEEAKNRGVTEISLDATQFGRALYLKCGFVDSEECMILTIKN